MSEQGSPNSREEYEYGSGTQESYDDEGSECNITGADLEQIAELVDVIKEIYADVDENVESVSYEIDSNIQSIMKDLGDKLTPELAQEVASVYNLNAKFAFYNVCFSKAFDILQKVDPKISRVFSTIQDVNVQVIQKFTEKLLALHPTITDLIQRLEEQNQDSPSRDNHINNQAAQEWENERARMQAEIEELRQENLKCVDKILKQNKQIKKMKSDAPAVNTIEPEQDEDINEPAYASTITHNRKSRYSKEEGPCIMTWNDLDHGVKTSTRVITLKQIKDLIEEICQSKEKYDSKCAIASLPRETMEQHMYSVLNQKFGLKNLVVEWVSALINGIRRYWKKDNDVAVFTMILRNECDEEFRSIQKQVKSTIEDLFKTTIKSKFPRKKNSELRTMLKEKINGFIHEDEAVEILRYIYNEEDFNEIIGKIETALFEIEEETTHKGRGEKGKTIIAINYADFEKIILDFQLTSHHNFLSKFISIFRVYDQSNFGYIDEGSFREMAQTIDPEGRLDADKLLTIIDPHEMDVITFSTCVSVFSTEPINGQESVTILQYISDEK